MRQFILIVLVTLLPSLTQAGLRVFACEPEYAALAETIAGDLVKADSATNALQDPHYIQARPSLIAKVRRADIVICAGAQLEIGWLPMLLSKANNRKVMPGTDGFIEASGFVRRLEVPASLDRAKGDIHPQGNPHVHVNPHNLVPIARVLTERMIALDSENAQVYQAGLDAFLQRWEKAIAGWEERGASLKGMRVVAHHKSWVYLIDWLGMEETATLEPVPGIPPTAAHLGHLLDLLGSDGKGADVIIRAPYQSDKASHWLSERTGIRATLLPLSVGGSEGATDLFSLFDDLLDRLLGGER